MNLIKSILHKALNMASISVNTKTSDLKLDLYNNQIAQRQLFFSYRSLKNQAIHMPEFHDTGFRVYSQSDEDGLLLYIFSLIGFTNKICVDMAFGSPYGANTTNLISNWGFQGLLIVNSNYPTKFFETHKDTSGGFRLQTLNPPGGIDA